MPNPFDYPRAARVYRASLVTDPYRAVEVLTPIGEHAKASVRALHMGQGMWLPDAHTPTTVERSTAARILSTYRRQAREGFVTLHRYEI